MDRKNEKREREREYAKKLRIFAATKKQPSVRISITTTSLGPGS